MNVRRSIEEGILGGCLLENGYIKIANILTSKNFSSWPDNYNHATIFEAVETLFPQAVDIITVSGWVAKNKSLNLSYQITDLSTKVNSTANIQAHALILLEIDITEKFQKLLSSLSVKADLLHSSALNEMLIEAKKPHTDIFQLIDDSIAYFRKIDADQDVLTGLENFRKAIDTKAVLGIKKNAKMDALFSHFYTLYSSGSYQQIKTILKLLDTAKNAGKLSHSQIKLIEQI